MLDLAFSAGGIGLFVLSLLWCIERLQGLDPDLGHAGKRGCIVSISKTNALLQAGPTVQALNRPPGSTSGRLLETRLSS